MVFDVPPRVEIWTMDENREPHDKIYENPMYEFLAAERINALESESLYTKKDFEKDMANFIKTLPTGMVSA